MEDFQTSREPPSSQSHKSGWRHHTFRMTKKFLESVARFASTVISCYPRAPPITQNTPNMDDNHHETQILDLPNEMLVHILSKCDHNSKMKMRAANWRFYWLVENSAKYLTRGDLVGGVEISYGDAATGSNGTEHGDTRLALRRPGREIQLPAYRLTNLFRHVRVWHTFLLKVVLDEDITLDLLDGKFGTVEHMYVDRVHSVTSETLARLVQKVNPRERLHFANHNSVESETAFSSAVFQCRTKYITIDSDVEHRLIDDEALVDLVLSDLIVRRYVRYRRTVITHDGILSAASASFKFSTQQFYNACEYIMEDYEDYMNLPVWEVTIALPTSPLIDLDDLTALADLLPRCRTVNIPAEEDHPAMFLFEMVYDKMFFRVFIF